MYKINEGRKVLGFTIPTAHQRLMADSGLCEKFDPYDFVEIRKNIVDDGNERVYLSLPVKAQALWFRSVYPEGRIEPVYKGMENGIAYIVEVRLYKNDRENTLPFATGIAVTNPGEKRPDGETLIGFANIIASSMAYTNAGFNIPPLTVALADYNSGVPVVPFQEIPAEAAIKPESELKKPRKKKEPEITKDEISAPPLEAISAPDTAASGEIVPVVVIDPEAIDEKLNAEQEVNYDAYDRKFSMTEIPELAKVMIIEGGQHIEAGKLILAGGPVIKWLKKLADDENVEKSKRAQGKIVAFLDECCNTDPSVKNLLKEILGLN